MGTATDVTAALTYIIGRGAGQNGVSEIADGTWTLTNRTRDGREERFSELVFHGGPGSTLEMRVFSRAALERAFREAGFARVRIASEPYLPFGIHWPEPWSVPMVAYAPK